MNFRGYDQWRASEADRCAEELAERSVKPPDFEHSFTNWPLECDCRLNLMLVESSGKTLDELIMNAEISIEDWHGNEGPAWTIGDLHSKDYDAVIEMFKTFLEETA